MGIFLRIDEIEGEVVHVDYLGQIEILDWSWGASNGSTPGSTKGPGTATPGSTKGKSTVDDLVVTKYTDKSTPKLYERAFGGLKIPTATLTITQSGPEGEQKAFSIDMKGGILVSGLQSSWADGDTATIEEVSLRFKKADTKFYRYSDTGPLLGTEDARWNGNKKSGRARRRAPKAGPPVVAP